MAKICHDDRDYVARARKLGPNGQVISTPFPGNKIDPTRFDPTTKKFISLLDTLGVKAQNSNLTGNYLGVIPSQRYSVIPSFKIDHSISSKDKLSFYYQETNLENQVSVEQHYLRNTPILVSTLTDADGGVAEIFDFCPRFQRSGRMYRPVAFIRIVRPLAGPWAATQNSFQLEGPFFSLPAS